MAVQSIETARRTEDVIRRANQALFDADVKIEEREAPFGSTYSKGGWGCSFDMHDTVALKDVPVKEAERGLTKLDRVDFETAVTTEIVPGVQKPWKRERLDFLGDEGVPLDTVFVGEKLGPDALSPLRSARSSNRGRDKDDLLSPNPPMRDRNVVKPMKNSFSSRRTLEELLIGEEVELRSQQGDY